MKQILFGSSVLLTLGMLAMNAVAQQHNVGRYVKIAENSNFTTYERVWSGYVADIGEEPLRPSDFIVPPGGGGWCDPSTNICFQPRGTDAPATRGSEVYRIRVVGRRRERSLSGWLAVLQGGGSPNPGETVMVARLHTPPPENCNTSEPTVNDNAETLADVWEDSQYSENRRLRESSSYAAEEQGWFILPDGEVQRVEVGATIGVGEDAVTVQSVIAGPCSLSFGPFPTSWPEGTIFGHSHPWRRNDNQTEACGRINGHPRPRYRPGPGTLDRPALRAMGISRGVIIDADGVHIYNEDNSDVSSHERCH